MVVGTQRRKLWANSKVTTLQWHFFCFCFLIKPKKKKMTKENGEKGCKKSLRESVMIRFLLHWRSNPLFRNPISIINFLQQWAANFKTGKCLLSSFQFFFFFSVPGFCEHSSFWTKANEWHLKNPNDVLCFNIFFFDFLFPPRVKNEKFFYTTAICIFPPCSSWDLSYIMETTWGEKCWKWWSFFVS